MTITRDPFDLPKDQITDLAESAIRRAGGPRCASVYFKYTCDHCGVRQTFEAPNTLYDSGECSECHAITPITRYGFMLVIDTAGKDPLNARPNRRAQTGDGVGCGASAPYDHDRPKP